MMNMKMWQEILPANDGGAINPILYEQYDLINGGWPNDYNEIVLVVDENNEVDDMTLYALGLKSQAEIEAMTEAEFAELVFEPALEEGEEWETRTFDKAI